MSKLKIFIAGHKGMVGSALVRHLKTKKVEIITRSRSELDFLNQHEVQRFFKNQKIDQVYLAAAKVGGIHANNTFPAEFIYENLMIQTNIIHSSFLGGVKKLLFLGSSCIYPKNANQPMKEEELLTGKLEPTNEPYAIAKIAGIKLCQSIKNQYKRNYFSIMPCNMYGPGDNFDLRSSHVLPAILKKIHTAKLNHSSKVILWGNGTPKREFLHVDDFSDAVLKIINKIKNKNIINVGSGKEISIRELSYLIKKIVGFDGKIIFDSKMPNGVNRKVLDISILESIGWKPKIKLEHGISRLYEELEI